MSPEHHEALELVDREHHVLWDEHDTPVRHLFCDLFLDKLLELSYYQGKPYCFVVSEDGRRALQAMRMGNV